MFSGKVILEKLPIGGLEDSERIILSDKGMMVQIINRANEAIKHIVYWDLDSNMSNQERGHHFHKKKIENFYILSGEIDLFLYDLVTSEHSSIHITSGNRITIYPRVAHAFKSRTYSQAIEYSSILYDPNDTYPYQLSSS